jgi:hypothetical protein
MYPWSWVLFYPSLHSSEHPYPLPVVLAIRRAYIPGQTAQVSKAIMPFLAEKTFPIPNKDLLSWIFDEQQFDIDTPVWED